MDDDRIEVKRLGRRCWQARFTADDWEYRTIYSSRRKALRALFVYLKDEGVFK